MGYFSSPIVFGLISIIALVLFVLAPGVSFPPPVISIFPVIASRIVMARIV
jgi:hypothetical protein